MSAVSVSWMPRCTLLWNVQESDILWHALTLFATQQSALDRVWGGLWIRALPQTLRRNLIPKKKRKMLTAVSKTEVSEILFCLHLSRGAVICFVATVPTSREKRTRSTASARCQGQPWVWALKELGPAKENPHWKAQSAVQTPDEEARIESEKFRRNLRMKPTFNEAWEESSPKGQLLNSCWL